MWGMKTKARVIFTRSSTRFVSAQKINGSITVFELLGCEQVSFGEVLRGALDELGNQDIYNETRDEGLSVFVHERDLSVQDGVENHFARLAPEISHK